MEDIISGWFAENAVREGYAAEKKIRAYIRLLSEEKGARNIIGTVSPERLQREHIVPSMKLAGIVIGKNGVDVGSGNGLPGLVIAIMDPGKKVCLMEPGEKRMFFIRRAARELGLDNVSFACVRAEEAGRSAEYREKFDFGTCRAVARLDITAELVLPLLKKNGTYYAQKGASAAAETEKSRDVISLMGGSLQSIGEDNTIIIRKSGSTPEEYPRKWNRIIRQKP
ncbi:MAG: 16S rRNA (guanine(527)-N(7))-methyltransferase RsmG [Elusimicrobia bacterium]|nr:16S rRNA (guanine(527)-N(7))-methyltransferase RsmG [Elusimicrobiota bacterium]